MGKIHFTPFTRALQVRFDCLLKVMKCDKMMEQCSCGSEGEASTHTHCGIHGVRP